AISLETRPDRRRGKDTRGGLRVREAMKLSALATRPTSRSLPLRQQRSDRQSPRKAQPHAGRGRDPAGPAPVPPGSPATPREGSGGPCRGPGPPKAVSPAPAHFPRPPHSPPATGRSFPKEGMAMRSRVLFPLLTFLTWLVAPAAQARAQGKDIVLVESAAEVIDCLTAIPDKSIPPALLCDAQGVAIFPDMLKASFILGGRYGRGVLLVRDQAGGWSNPIFLTMTGGSVGWQAGAQSTDLVLIFRTARSVDRFLKGKGKITLGADASVAAGPVGREAAAATDVLLRAEIFTYSRSRGLFAGVSVVGDVVRIDWSGNERFYGNREVCPADIVANRNIRIPEAALKLRATLARQSAP